MVCVSGSSVAVLPHLALKWLDFISQPAADKLSPSARLLDINLPGWWAVLLQQSHDTFLLRFLCIILKTLESHEAFNLDEKLRFYCRNDVWLFDKGNNKILLKGEHPVALSQCFRCLKASHVKMLEYLHEAHPPCGGQRCGGGGNGEIVEDDRAGLFIYCSLLV